MHNPQLIKSFDASGAIASHRIVQLDSNGQAKQAASSNDAMIGTTELAYSSGDRTDVAVEGIVEVQAGASVSIGDFITSDSNGKAVPADDRDNVIGVAISAASDGEYASVRLAPSRPAAAPSDCMHKGVSGSAAVAAKRIVKLGSDGKWNQASAASDALVGIAVEESDNDYNFDVAYAGIAEVEAGGSITAGSFVTADSNGKAVTAAYTNSYVGMALEGASSGDTIPVAIHLGKIEHEEVGG